MQFIIHKGKVNRLACLLCRFRQLTDRQKSVVLDIIKHFWLLQRLLQLPAILDVAIEVGHATVEDVPERMFPQEEVTENAQLPAEGTFQPHPSKIRDSIDVLLTLTKFLDELLEGHLGTAQ